MAQKRKSQNNRNNGRRRYSGSRHNSDQEMAQSVSFITADALRATADRVAENTMTAADIIHEQAEQLVEDLRQQSDLMARQVESFFGRWVKLVTLPTQMTREAVAKVEEMREEQRAA